MRSPSPQKKAPTPAPSQQQGPVIHIKNLDHLKQVIAANKGVVVDFWGSFCRPCVVFKPVFEQCAKDNTNKNVVFAMVNTQDAGDCAGHYQIRSIPAFKFIHNGEVSDEFVGASKDMSQRAVDKLSIATGGKAAAPPSPPKRADSPMKTQSGGYAGLSMQEQL